MTLRTSICRMIRPCGGAGMKPDVVGRQKNWF
jgi:hypothetical protein